MAGVAAAKTLRPCRLVLTRQGNNLECCAENSLFLSAILILLAQGRGCGHYGAPARDQGGIRGEARQQY